MIVRSSWCQCIICPYIGDSSTSRIYVPIVYLTLTLTIYLYLSICPSTINVHLFAYGIDVWGRGEEIVAKTFNIDCTLEHLNQNLCYVCVVGSYSI